MPYSSTTGHVLVCFRQKSMMVILMLGPGQKVKADQNCRNRSAVTATMDMVALPENWSTRSTEMPSLATPYLPTIFMHASFTILYKLSASWLLTAPENSTRTSMSSLLLCFC